VLNLTTCYFFQFGQNCDTIVIERILKLNTKFLKKFFFSTRRIFFYGYRYYAYAESGVKRHQLRLSDGHCRFGTYENWLPVDISPHNY